MRAELQIAGRWHYVELAYPNYEPPLVLAGLGGVAREYPSPMADYPAKVTPPRLLLLRPGRYPIRFGGQTAIFDGRRAESAMVWGDICRA